MRIGPWALEGELGRGGMGAVYRGRDARGRLAAVKVLTAGGDLDLALRFQREVAALRRLEHPAVATVLDAGVEHGRPWLAMRLVEGPSLAARLRTGGALGWREAAQVVARVARGVAHAHARGVLHRDLKASNVLLGPEGPVLVDFGLVRAVTPEGSLAGLTRTGQVAGTPGFMAPEQAQGEVARIGPHTDVYGLGALLFEALTGRAPFVGPSALATLEAVVEAPAEAPSRHAAPGADVPAALDALCLACLAKDPAARPAAAEAVALALEALVAGRGRARGRQAGAVRGGPGAGRSAMLVVLCAAVVLAAVGLGVLALRAGRPPEPATGPSATPAAGPERQGGPGRRDGGAVAAGGDHLTTVEPTARAAALADLERRGHALSAWLEADALIALDRERAAGHATRGRLLLALGEHHAALVGLEAHARGGRDPALERVRLEALAQAAPGRVRSREPAATAELPELTALVHARQGEVELAVEACPSDPARALPVVDALFELGATPAAEAVCARALAQGGPRGPAHGRLEARRARCVAWLAQLQGELARPGSPASVALTEALDRARCDAPGHPDVARAELEVEALLGAVPLTRVREALHLRRAARHEPPTALADLELFACLVARLGTAQEADDALSRHLALTRAHPAPDVACATTLAMRAEARLENDDPQGGLADYEGYLTVQPPGPGDWEVRARHAAFLAAVGRHQDAQRALQQIPASVPVRGAALAALEIARGDAAAALAALGPDPGHAPNLALRVEAEVAPAAVIARLRSRAGGPQGLLRDERLALARASVVAGELDLAEEALAPLSEVERLTAAAQATRVALLGARDERPAAAAAPAPSAATPAPAGAAASAGQDDLSALDDGEDPPVPIAKIYAAAKLGPPAHGFSLERIAGMLADPRLAALDDASRAGAVAVLLEGAGVPVASVVEEAATRDAALDRFEAFLTGKADEAAREAAETDARVEAEIARFVASKREEQARARDRLVERRRQLARYLRVKRAEELRLFEVVRPFTSDVPVSVTGGLPGRTAAPAAAAGPSEDLAAPPAGPQPAADPTGIADTGTYRRPELDPPAPAPPDPFRDAARKLREDRERRGPG